MPPLEAGSLTFQCNICGAMDTVLLDALGRETASCASCISTPRTRAIVNILLTRMLQREVTLPDCPTDKSRRGLGLSDPFNYARPLAIKFDYENTFFHQEPKLDISAALPPERLGSYDFVISSEVFEHVVPPVERAFENVFRLLKPGGLFVLTVPYGLAPHTIEHFPELYDFSIAQQDDVCALTNVTREGVVQKFDQLIFHGGPGTTLEMRVFAEQDLIRILTAAGFSEIEVRRRPVFKHAIWWPQPWSLPISAKRPGGASPG